MLGVEKVGRIPRVERHGLEAFVRCEWRAGPLPEPSRVALAPEAVPIASDRRRMPAFEADIMTLEADEEFLALS